MKIFGAATAWLIGFALLGAIAMVLGFGIDHPHQFGLLLKLAGLGAECGFTIFLIGFCFALLPGARRPPGEPQPFGLIQGIWGMLGFGAALAIGGLLLTNVLAIEDFALIAVHNPARVDFGGRNFLLGTALSGEAAAALWVAWYFRRLGPVRTGDGTATGIAWRPAPVSGYATAALCALGIIIFVVMLYHLIPPDIQKLQALPMAKLFSGSPLSLLPLLIVAIFIGPVLEEFVFRGIGFSGLATRFGPLWAGVITTLVFMAAHAQEKIHYLPGFIDVGMLAATAVWLRLKFHSIRPGILMHILYNAGSMVAASFM